MLVLFMCLVTTGNTQTVESLLRDHFSSQELKSANTAVQVEYLNTKEKQVVQYTNLARMHPRKFAKFYLDYLEKIDRGGYRLYQKRNYYYTTLYRDLMDPKRKPRAAWKLDATLTDYAECWAVESGEKGVIGHDRATCSSGRFAECCSYSYKDDPMNFVINLLVDHRVSSLGHRKAMLGGYKKVGVSIQPHSGYGHCVVLDMTY